MGWWMAVNKKGWPLPPLCPPPFDSTARLLPTSNRLLTIVSTVLAQKWENNHAAGVKSSGEMQGSEELKVQTPPLLDMHVISFDVCQPAFETASLCFTSMSELWRIKFNRYVCVLKEELPKSEHISITSQQSRWLLFQRVKRTRTLSLSLLHLSIQVASGEHQTELFIRRNPRSDRNVFQNVPCFSGKRETHCRAALSVLYTSIIPAFVW